jgi:glycyl-tRNA synthetase (class II)
MSAKIADFGIAQHGKSSGAFGYLAPECTTGIFYNYLKISEIRVHCDYLS